jgi:squalene-hopene/tetraprenyl-beta-curcumene cyclase
MALDRADSDRFSESIARATPWVQALQSKGGGWAAFDADNTHFYLNHIPFADHGALLDPPTADVTARCLGMLCQLGHAPDHPAVKRAVDWLLAEQEEDGSWFGRWGTNYIYGTWSALAGLNAAGTDLASAPIRRAVDWLLSKQRPDGSWGEDGGSYWRGEPPGEGKEGTASQTAWAMLALMAAGEVHHPAVARGAQWLMAHQTETGLWDEEWYTAVGFPRVFYLRYHGYRAVFPLWALARYRNLRPTNDPKVCWGL